MKITFYGAARTVTGSQHLVEISGKKILLDCGLYQGRREESYNKNKNLPFNPAEIDTVILSHAHIDHSGNLPSLHKKGFTGKIYATPATIDLCKIMLQDSGHIQENDIKFVNKKKRKKGEKPFKPLYTKQDAWNVTQHFRPVKYYDEFDLPGFNGNVKLKFYDAGHILGSAQTVLEIKNSVGFTRFAFTGDIGRPGLPILRDPDKIDNVDCIISESTYGNRVHDKSSEIDVQFSAIINKVYSKSGKLIIPAFSVGRTQEIVYAYGKLLNEGKIPKMKIFVDSPLSTDATKIFKLHTDSFDEEALELLNSGVDLFGSSKVTYVRDAKESMKLNKLKEPCIIISASGMCETGRILHHLRNNIEDESNTILIVGFMAQHTLGRRLIDTIDSEYSTVNIFGEPHSVNAEVKVLNSFSAHADKNELHEYFSQFDKKRLQNIFLVHGEYSQQEALQKNLKEMEFLNVYVPEEGEIFEV